LAGADHDGKVSLAECQRSRCNFVLRADRNKDGRISADEWTKGAALLQAQYRADGADLIGKGAIFPALNAKSDGFASAGEINAASRRKFSVYGKDTDGQIVRTEARVAAGGAHAR
jgi:hypothetical protein